MYRRHGWAWRLRLEPNVKFVLMALADACDDDGYCWPGVTILAKETALGDCGVQRIPNQRKTDALIRMEPRFRQDNSPTGNGCRFPLDRPAGKGIGRDEKAGAWTREG